MKIGGAKIVFLGSAPLPLRRRGDAILEHDEILAGSGHSSDSTGQSSAWGGGCRGKADFLERKRVYQPPPHRQRTNRTEQVTGYSLHMLGVSYHFLVP